ncbi:MAG: hypothetical protein ABSG78_18620 [Verrucomicrobiota bacterium]|jgi:hypothetical protein
MRNLNEIEDNQVTQLEFGIAGRRSRGLARQRRVQRAQWWFTQMRRVVDRAVAWPSTPPARPEQVHLTLASRRN